MRDGKAQRVKGNKYGQGANAATSCVDTNSEKKMPPSNSLSRLPGPPAHLLTLTHTTAVGFDCLSFFYIYGRTNLVIVLN